MSSQFDFYIKEGDRAPSLLVRAVDEKKEIIPLDAAIGVKFFLNNPGEDAPKIDGKTASIVAPPSSGQMEYLWDDADTADPGDYDGEFEVEWSDGTKTTFPNFRYLKVKISRSIDTTD